MVGLLSDPGIKSSNVTGVTSRIISYGPLYRDTSFLAALGSLISVVK
jgi:hypothetical protein